jgi:recombination protein RecA
MIKDLEKEFGEGFFPDLSGFEPKPPDVISTGSYILDHSVLVIGGVARGRSTEIAGKEGIGKTTVSLHLVANAQKQNLLAAFINAENKVDLNYAHKLGVDVPNLILANPVDGEQALAIADSLIQRALEREEAMERLGLIVFDSAAALGSMKEQEVDFIKNADVAKIPRLLNKFFRRRIYHLRELNIAIVFTNQLRDVIGQSWGGTTTPGGHGFHHFQSTQLHLTKAYPQGDIKEDNQVIGHRVKAVTKKHNVAESNRVGIFDIFYGRGIDYEADVFNAALEYEAIIKRGSFFRFHDEIIAQGKLNTIYELKSRPELLEEVIKEMRNGKNN